MLNKTKVVFICPFNLNRLTGSPIRAKITIHAAEQFADVVVVSSNHFTNLVTFTRQALETLRLQRPEVLHGFTTVSILPMLLYKILFSQKVKIVFEMHGWSWFELGAESPLFKRSVFLFLDYLGLWFSSLVIAMSLRERDFLIQRTWKPWRVVVQWCVVESFNPFKQSALSRPLRVGYIGNSAWWQGLPHLIAMAKILKNRSDITFLLAGFDARDKNVFPNLENVSYLGKIEREKVTDFLQSCDVLISPRLKELVSDLQFPQKFSEYLAAGRPVIASATGDQSLVLKEAGCGIVVDPLNPENLAQAIVSFANLPATEQRLWGERAYTYARRHLFFNVLVNNLQGFYHRIGKKMHFFDYHKQVNGKKKALIIGAGIHGATIAIELGKANYEVEIIDSNPDILMGTSGATHNRIHLGCHYPKSTETALECKVGYSYFKKHFADSVVYPDFYYVIEKNNSNVSAREYRDFLNRMDLEYTEEWPDELFLNREKIEAPFKVKEGYFDIVKLREIIKARFKKYEIKTRLNFPVVKVEFQEGRFLTLCSDKNDFVKVEADLIINATYTNTNNVQKAFGLKDYLTEYEFENTEIAVVECPYEIPALTVSNGPFITILPYGGHKGQYLVYDVLNSVASRSFGIKFVPDENKKSNWELMLKHGLEYYPFFKDLKYKSSLWANRPIPLAKEAQKNDSRATRIIKHDYPINFYSILEGKLVSAPMIAEDLISWIRRENND